MKTRSDRTRRKERRARRAGGVEMTGTVKGVSINVERATALGMMLGVHRKRHELLVGTALTPAPSRTEQRRAIAEPAHKGRRNARKLCRVTRSG